MNSDKQGRAMCACGSSGAAPGAEPAAAAPQCRCRTAPRAPSPAQNITAAIAAADLTGTGFLRLRSFAASNAQPVPDVIVTISQRSGTGIPDKTVTTGPEALSDDVAIACPPRSYSLDENNRTVLPYAVVDVTAEHEGYDPVHVAGVQVFDGEVSLLELLQLGGPGQRADNVDVDVIRAPLGGGHAGQAADALLGGSVGALAKVAK